MPGCCYGSSSRDRASPTAARKDYKRIPVNEQVEMISLLGDIALGEQGEPKVHAHVVIGTAEGQVRGGHLLEGHVQPTLDVMVVESPAELRRRIDKETGLALIDLGDSLR